MCLLAFLLVSQIQEGADDMDPSSHGGERLISVVTGSPVVDELALRKTFFNRATIRGFKNVELHLDVFLAVQNNCS